MKDDCTLAIIITLVLWITSVNVLPITIPSSLMRYSWTFLEKKAWLSGPTLLHLEVIINCPYEGEIPDGKRYVVDYCTFYCIHRASIFVNRIERSIWESSLFGFIIIFQFWNVSIALLPAAAEWSSPEEDSRIL